MNRKAVCRDSVSLRILNLDDLPPIEFGEAPTVDAVLVIGRIGEHESQLFASERGDDIEGFSAQRKAEYASGRRVAHEALQLLSGMPAAVNRKGRQPEWPVGYCGAISHSREIALAMVASKKACRGIGLDVVKKEAVSEKVGDRIMLTAEGRSSSAYAESDWRAILFSANESVYKAVHPEIGEFLECRDVEIELHGSDQMFTATTVEERPSSSIVRAGIGFITDFEDHWLTLFLV